MSATLAEDSDTTPANQAPQWLSFQISGRHFAVPLSGVSEVTREGELVPVPGAASELLGIRQLRGRIVPVMDGRRRLDLPSQLAADPSRIRIVMLCWDDHLVGLRVDAVGALINADVEDVHAQPLSNHEHQPSLVTGVLAGQSPLVEVLDIRQIVRLKQAGMSGSQAASGDR